MGVYYSQGRTSKAAPLYQRSLAIREKAPEPQHPEAVTSRENYATLLRDTERKDKAKVMEARAKAIRAKHAQENPVE